MTVSLLRGVKDKNLLINGKMFTVLRELLETCQIKLPDQQQMLLLVLICEQKLMDNKI